jgi:hypothetical protein
MQGGCRARADRWQVHVIVELRDKHLKDNGRVDKLHLCFLQAYNGSVGGIDERANGDATGACVNAVHVPVGYLKAVIHRKEIDGGETLAQLDEDRPSKGRADLRSDRWHLTVD